MILLTTLYRMKKNERFDEVRKILKANIDNPSFKNIFIFFENFNKNDADYDFLKNIKVIIIDVSARQTYNQMVKFANENLIEETIVISNTDILFDKTITRAYEMELCDKKILALTRWTPEKDDSNVFKLELQTNRTVAWSFDTYIFKSPISIDLPSIDIKVGVGGCDTLLVKRLETDNNFTVLNPCIDIRTYHIDKQDRFRKDSFNNTDNHYMHLPDYPRGTHSKKATTTDGHLQYLSNTMRITFDYHKILN